MASLPSGTGPGREKRLVELADRILTTRRQLEDAYEVAAILESMGLSDRLVSETYGAEDVFALAEELWPTIRSKMVVAPFWQPPRPSLAQYIVRVVRSFTRGMIFALPMAVSVAAMLALDLSLWSYRFLSLENATAIAVGTILSFLSVGGFTQAIAHRGFLYVNQGYYYTARRTAFGFVGVGFALCCLLTVALFGVNLLFTIFPLRMMVVVLLYYLFLSAIWLSVTIMYMLQKELVFTGLITGGIALVWLLFQIFGFNILVAQLVSLTMVAIAGIGFAIHFFRAAEKKAEGGIKPMLPRLSIVVYTSLPFLLYGFLYFAFLFCDRVVAWSTNSAYMPYLIWFRGEYELGLDLALAVLVLPMGFIEVVVNELMSTLEGDQKSYLGKQVDQMSRAYLRLYIRRAVVIGLFALLNAILIYLGVNYLDESYTWWTYEFRHPTTQYVFIRAALAYVMVALSLMNALILLCFSRAERVIRSVGVALVINILVGFVLSRWFDYSWAVYGLMLGSAAFAALSTRQVVHILSRLDYYLFAASA